MIFLFLHACRVFFGDIMTEEIVVFSTTHIALQIYDQAVFWDGFEKLIGVLSWRGECGVLFWCCCFLGYYD